VKKGNAAAALILLMAVGNAAAQTASKEIDRSAGLRISFQGAPAAYDPPFSKNQFQETAYMLPIYDGLVRLDSTGNIVPNLALSWSFSDDGKTITMQLRQGVKFTDGSDLNADVVVRSLNRMKKDPGSLLAGQLKSYESFEAKGPNSVVLHLNTPDANALYPLATSTGMIVSGKALDDKVDLGINPVGTGPYKLISSGPQGATYERNENYFDKSQNQFAKLSIIPIVDGNSRLNALKSGQLDLAFSDINLWPEIQAMVKSGKFALTRVLEPNSFPLWINTNVKPFDNPKVRMAMNLAIDRDGINAGIQNGLCDPAAQAFMPGVVGFDQSLKPYKQDLEKAKALLKEAGVGPFSFDTIVTIAEPGASFGVAMKQQLSALGITMNILPTNPSQTRPVYRGGTYGAMLMTLSVPAPDPASIVDAAYMSPDNRGGVTPEFAKMVAEARTKPLGSPEREAAYKAIAKAAYDDPRHVFFCYSPILLVYRSDLVGVDKTAYVNAVPIPDVRTYGLTKK